MKVIELSNGSEGPVERAVVFLTKGSRSYYLFTIEGKEHVHIVTRRMVISWHDEERDILNAPYAGQEVMRWKWTPPGKIDSYIWFPLTVSRVVEASIMEFTV